MNVILCNIPETNPVKLVIYFFFFSIHPCLRKAKGNVYKWGKKDVVI